MLSLLMATATFLVSPTGSATRRQVPQVQMALFGTDTPKTIGDAKAAFNAAYARPVNSMEQGFVNELLSSSVVAFSSPSYKYSRVFSVGFDSLCEVFLESMANDSEREKLRSALCAGLGLDPKTVTKDAAALRELASSGGSEEALLACDDMRTIADATNWKYSYPFGAGLLALMPLVGTEPSEEAIERWCSSLGVESKRLKKDWAFFKDASQKLVEVRQMMLELAAAGKRKEAERLKTEAEKAAKEAKEAEALAAESD